MRFKVVVSCFILTKNNMRFIFAFAALLLVGNFISAREGMWLPQLLKNLNETEMRSMGMQISAEDIYSVNNGSIKDAVLQFGGGCTGELISDRGLLVTNHHCGFSQIQSLSTIEKNYLKDGYWSTTDQDEIPCPGLAVTFVREIKDVSKIILENIDEKTSEANRTSLIKIKSDSLEKAMSDKKSIKAFVRSFFAGNEYYLFITEVYKDIRFVGAPPQAVGKFGGETDNWVWPRHSADFSLFRIYVDKNNKSTDYSIDNIPYTPKRSLEINMGGIKENDFAMIYGFPGRTNEFVTSPALDLYLNQTDPDRVSIREKRLDVWRQDMHDNDTIRLQYAAKFSSLANYYKKWTGEMMGLRRFKVIEVKQEYEKSMIALSKGKLAPVLDSIANLNREIKPLSYASDYYTESLQGIELLNLVSKFSKLITLSNTDSVKTDVLKAEIDRLKNDVRTFYKNYSAKTDKKICFEMLTLSGEKLEANDKPVALKNFRSAIDIQFQTDKLFNSFLVDTSKVFSFLSSYSKKSVKKLEKDPAVIFYKDFTALSKNLAERISGLTSRLMLLQRSYVELIRTVDTSRVFYPDANSTLRVAYGKIKSVEPADGKTYKYFTTTDGVLEKSNGNNPDYSLPDNFRKILDDKNFGRYAVNGSVPVNFLASVHSTGGNSGSPVLNAKGQLIGINFDGLWEGIMTDLYYDESYCRNISLDVRYFLFIVDKLGNEKRLLDEMKIVN